MHPTPTFIGTIDWNLLAADHMVVRPAKTKVKVDPPSKRSVDLVVASQVDQPVETTVDPAVNTARKHPVTELIRPHHLAICHTPSHAKFNAAR